MRTVLIELVSIIAVLSYLAYNSPLGVFQSWINPMMYVLSTLIVVELLELIFGDYRSDGFITRTKIYSWIGLLLFSGFLIYDTQKIIIDGNKIVDLCDSGDQMICSDYPAASLGIFLDIVNLFNNLSMINRS
jgi:FtsH-binding integral membrane protein